MLTSLDQPGTIIEPHVSRGLKFGRLTSAAAVPNAAILNAILADPYLRSEIRLPGDVIFVGNPLVSAQTRGGPTIVGVSAWNNEITESDHSVRDTTPASNVVGPVTVLVYTGSTAGDYTASSLYRHRCAGSKFIRTSFQGRRITANNAYSGNKVPYGITLEHGGIGGLPTSKVEFDGCSFIQCAIGIYVPPLGQQDTILITGITWVQGCDTWFRSDEEQCVGIQQSGILNCNHDDPAFTLLDFTNTGGGSTASAGDVNFSGAVKFNRSGILLKTGKQAYTTSLFKFDFVRWDHTFMPNYTRPRVLIMNDPNEVDLRANIMLSNETSADYRRPLIFPKGESYNVRLGDLKGKLHQVDLDAWPEDGIISADDTCMDYVPAVTPAAWWHFGDPTTYGSPAEGAAVTSISVKAGSANNLTSVSSMTYDSDGMHFRPCLVGDGDNYTAANRIGANATLLYGSFAGWAQTNGTNQRTIASVTDGATDFVWAVTWQEDGAIELNVTSDGVVATSTRLESDDLAAYFQQSYIEWWFIGATNSCGRMGVRVNGSLKVRSHSLANTYNTPDAPMYILGGQNFAGSVALQFTGRPYDLKLDTALPAMTELALRRDSICSQIGAPVDVYVPMAVKGATNATPIVVTCGDTTNNHNHGLAVGDFVAIKGVLGNLAANGFFKVGSVPNDYSFSLQDVDGTNIAGSGTYTSGGTVTPNAMPEYTVTGATNATPIVITTSEAHGLVTGRTVLIQGVGGNTAANAVHKITVASTTTFSLQTPAGSNVAGSGAYTSGGRVTVI